MIGTCKLCNFDINSWEAYFHDREADVFVHEDCWWNQKVDHNAQVELQIPPGEFHPEGHSAIAYLRLGRDLSPIKRDPICPMARYVRAEIDNS